MPCSKHPTLWSGCRSLPIAVCSLLGGGEVWAQVSSINEFYAEPQVIIAPDSGDYPNLLNQAEVFDLNRDGRQDVVYSDYNPDDPEGLTQFHILMADGSGGMALQTDSIIIGEIPVTERGFRQAISGDFNNDGWPDLFLDSAGGEPACEGGGVECWKGGVNSLLLSNGAGQLENVADTHLPAYSDFSHGSSIADFDGDGDIDIWVNNLGGSPLYSPDFSYLMNNDGTGSFTLVADAAGQDQSPIVGRNGILPDGNLLSFWSFSVDAEGDGDIDLGLGWLDGPDRNVVLLNDGSGRFSLPSEPSFPSPPGYLGDRIQHALVHDVNGDGRDDVLLHHSRTDFTNPMLQVLISNGDGTFRDETTDRYPAAPVTRLEDFKLHDFDNDGHLDLFSGIDFSINDIYINDGEGYFRPLEANFLTNLGFNWVVLDVDGDGGSDIVSTEGEGLVLHKMIQPYGPDLDGSEQDDRLIGGAHDNFFRGLGGNDVLDGGLGNDTLVGGSGNDRIDSGRDNDLLEGGPGNDELNDWAGDETYILNAEDLTGNDLVWDYGGYDILVFADFGLDRVASVAQVEGGHLQINFTDGGSITIIAHFAGVGQAVERIRAGDCYYDIIQDDTFTSGAIESALGECYVLGSLSGTVVDAGDGVTPVHPVDIDLADPVTGEWLGIGVTNNEDGSYFFEEMPVGDFKVFFNAVGPADNYVDELYAAVPCDEGACDIANQGNIFSLLSGANVIDVGLTRQVALSGRVSKEPDAPMIGAGIEILDDSGTPVGVPAFTDANGEWVKGVPGPGTYYVRTVAESTPGYQAEVWDNVPCDDCDVTIDGVPIVVGALDIPGIDFELARIVYPEYDCRARDLIFSSAFEALPAREIVMTSNASGIITEAGQTLDFSVELLDEQGAVIDPSSLEWCLTDTKNLQLAASGGMATVSANGMGVKSAQLIVRDTASGEEARAMVIFAELRDDAFLLDDTVFIDGVTPPAGTTGTIVLQRTDFTQTLIPGMVIASGDRLGILVRILEVTVLADTVELLVEPASLHDFYARVKIEAESTPKRFRIVNDGGGVSQLQMLNKRGSVTQSFNLFGFECSFDVLSPSFTPSFNVEFITTEYFLYETDPFFDLPIEMELISSGRAQAQLDLDVQVKVGPQIDCKFENIPALPVAAFPAGPIPILIQVKPIPGFSGSVTAGETLFRLPTPILKGNLGWAAGLRWDFINGFDAVFSNSAFQAGWDAEIREIQDPQSFEYQAEFKPYIGANLGVGVVPSGPQFNLLTFDYSIPVSAGINPPLDWRDRNYVGPSWKVERANEFKFADDVLDLAEFILEQKLGLIGAKIAMAQIDPVLYSDTVPWFESPSNSTLDVVCQQGDCPVDPARSNEYFAWSVDFPSDYNMGEGRAELVGWKDGASEAVSLSADFLLFDGADGEWWPQEADLGNWNFRGMVWDRDLLNIGKYFPYPTVYSTTNYEVATSWTLDIILSGAGKVTSSPAGINCNWSNYPQECRKDYVDGTPITLTAQDVEGYRYIGWDSGASSNYACAGSTSKTCVFNISADTFAFAMYEEIPSYQVSVNKQLANGTGTGGGLVQSEDGSIDCGGTCSAPFLIDTPVSLIATDTPGANFVKWADNSPVCAGSIGRTCAFTVSGPVTARAVFTQPVDVSVQKISINTGLDVPGGLITSSPSGINCGSQCANSFVSGGELTLTASSSGGWNFRYWTSPSECATEENRESASCNVALTSSKVARAVFEPDPVTITDITFGAYTQIGEPCPSFNDSAIIQATATFTGTMEESGFIESISYWDNDADGTIDGGGSGQTYPVAGQTLTDGALTWGEGYCWGGPDTILWRGLRYISPVGVESNEVRKIVPRP